MIDRSRIAKGFDVYTRDDYKVGSVELVDPEYVEVSTGFLGLGRPRYIPYDVISRVDAAEREILLSVDHDALSAERRWHDRPGPVPAAGMLGGTMPAAAAGPGSDTWIPPEDLRGRTLYDSEGKPLGRVASVGDNYAEVPGGLLGHGGSVYVPFDAISYCDPRGCHLKATVEEIDRRDWSRPPAERRSARIASGAPPDRPAPDEEVFRPLRVPLREEQLQTTRRRVPLGEVVVQRVPRSEQRTLDVPVARQEIEIERRFVDRTIPAGVDPFLGAGREYRFPIYEERVEIVKVPRVREELVVQPREVIEQRQFTETVMRETADVDVEGDAADFVHTTGSATGSRSWSEVMPTYRQDWERRHGAGGPRWEDVEPAYQFAYTNYHDPAYQNLTWTDAEPRLRPAWEMRYPDRPWSRARMYVQDEWDHLRGTT